MDLLGYAALGGLERLTIVAGAVIIGYWGYRLYTAEKNAGLLFMGLSVVVLVGRPPSNCLFHASPRVEILWSNSCA